MCLQSAESPVQAKERMVFQNGHIYHINSLSLNRSNKDCIDLCIMLYLLTQMIVCYSDGETFLTSDDLRINLWHTGVNTECFNIVCTISTNSRTVKVTYELAGRSQARQHGRP